MPSRAEREALKLVGENTRVPIPIDEIAEQQGIAIVYALYQGDTSGVLMHEPDGRRVIGVNTYHSETRQRFTIAHELGHAILHLQTRPVGRAEVVVDKPREIMFRDGRSSTATDNKEIEANRFAAELLMPAHLVRTLFHSLVSAERRLSADDIVRTLADNFDVSTQAMGYRLMKLDLIDPVWLLVVVSPTDLVG